MAAAENPLFTSNLRAMIASLIALHRMEDAAAAAAAMMRLEPDFSLARYENFTQPF